MRLYAIYAFHLVYFMSYGISSFLTKYLGEIGLLDWQIGMMTSVSAIVGVLIQPYWGMLTDRIQFKKTVLIVLLAALSLICFWLNNKTAFLMVFLGMILFSIAGLPIGPTYSVITLEFLQEIGKPYGPVRVVGTLGFQAGTLIAGAVFVSSLQGVYALMGGVSLISLILAMFLPPVKGHQHGREKMSIRVLFLDKQIVWLLGMVLIGTITSSFYMIFFSKHMGDLAISNQWTGVIFFVSVLLELPFLWFANHLSKKTNIWNWVLIGYLVNAIRFIGFGLFSSVPMLLLFQLPAVSVMACFEFFPILYLNARAPDELKASAQNLLMIVAFGISKVIGSLLGILSGRIGIPNVFILNGVLLLLMAVLFWKPTRALVVAEGNVLRDEEA